MIFGESNRAFMSVVSPGMFLSFFSISVASFFAGDGVAAPPSSFAFDSGLTLTFRLSNIPGAIDPTAIPAVAQTMNLRAVPAQSTIPALTFEHKAHTAC